MGTVLLNAFVYLFFFGFVSGSMIGPGAQIADARDAQRRSDVNTILNAVYQHAIDNGGALPESIPLKEPQEICASEAPVEPCVDLSVLEGTYLVSMPSDPSAPAGRTLYTIVKSGENRVTVTAMEPERADVISITR
jgi:hypothetical protein